MSTEVNKRKILFPNIKKFAFSIELIFFCSGIRNFHPPMFTSTLSRRHRDDDLPPPYDEPSPPPYHIAIQV